MDITESISTLIQGSIALCKLLIQQLVVLHKAFLLLLATEHSDVVVRGRELDTAGETCIKMSLNRKR